MVVLICPYISESKSHSVVSNSLQAHGLYSPWNSPGQNTGVGSISLQGIFSTLGLNPGLLHCRQILYHLSHQGSPRILEWVAYPFSRGSSWPRNRTGVSCIAGRFFTSWAMRKPSYIFEGSPHIIFLGMMILHILPFIYSLSVHPSIHYFLKEKSDREACL